MEDIEQKAWEEALEYAFDQADKNPWDKGQNYRNYAIENEGKLYPNKVIYRYAIDYLEQRYPEIYNEEVIINTGVGKEMNDYLAKKGAKALVLDSSKNNLLQFKSLLEYFVSHLEWVVNEDSSNVGYSKYIKPLIEDNSFKKTGQGYAGAKIQEQIKEWKNYDSGDICINIQSNYGNYKTVKCYLNWRGTGINIIARWKDDRVFSLYQDEFIYWEEPTRRVNLGVEFTVEELQLFDNDLIDRNIVLFYDSFVSILEERKYISKQYELMKAVLENKILLEYKKQIILQGPPGTGKTRLAKDIAKVMINKNSPESVNLTNHEQFKIVQFHPSYTYEDFVRGIATIPNENGIEYQVVDRGIAEFANQALENYRNSQKKGEEISHERAVFAGYEAFKLELESELNDDKTINLTKAVDIVDFDEDSFLYKGHVWQGQAHRMHHRDIVNAYLAGNRNRQDIKKNMSLSGSARQHASYYVVILQKFFDYIERNPLNITGNSIEKEELQNYVMVIDEINRANLSSVLGELIYALEYRGKGIEGMYSKAESDKIILPPNLYIIGTMNTADRSVGHIDYAIRRRFAFVDVLPKDLSEDSSVTFYSKLFNTVKELFTTDDYMTKSSFLSSEFDPKDVALGHSYFIQQYEKDAEGNDDKSKPYDFALRLEYEIKPILREYIKDGILIGTGIEQEVEALQIEELKEDI